MRQVADVFRARAARQIAERAFEAHVRERHPEDLPWWATRAYAHVFGRTAAGARLACPDCASYLQVIRLKDARLEEARARAGEAPLSVVRAARRAVKGAETRGKYVLPARVVATRVFGD